MGYVGEHPPDKSELDACIQCGLCLPFCPTFRLTGRESASPRGRLQVMSLVLTGEATVDDGFDEVMSFCLGCRACEAVCPGLVPYGRVFEGARNELAIQRPTIGRRIRRLMLGGVIDQPLTMKLITLGAALTQRLRLGGLLPSALRSSFGGMRRLPLWPTVPVVATGGSRGVVGLLSGCVMQPWFGEVHQATIGLLQQAGYRVVVPADQGCCGALAGHDGHAEQAERMIEVNRRAFAGCEMVVADAAGCSAHLKAHLPGPGFTGEILDITELVARLIEDGSLPAFDDGSRGSVAVQDPCHLRHAQRVVGAPRRVLRAAGYVPVEIDPDGLCCGAAGVYSLIHPDASARLGAIKADQIRATGLDLVSSANPGCEMQLRSHLGPDHRVVHPVELLWERLRADDRSLQRFAD